MGADDSFPPTQGSIARHTNFAGITFLDDWDHPGLGTLLHRTDQHLVPVLVPQMRPQIGRIVALQIAGHATTRYIVAAITAYRKVFALLVNIVVLPHIANTTLGHFQYFSLGN